MGVSLLDQRGRWTDIHGSRLRGLERNLVRFRTGQIVLFLHKAEALKEFLEDLGDGACPRVLLSDKAGQVPSHLSNASWKRMAPWRRANERLLERALIDSSMRDSICELIGFRNAIAHEIHYLFGDLGTTRWNREFLKDADLYPHRFEYRNLKRLSEIADFFDREISGRFIMTLRLEHLLFDSVERFLEIELKRLRPIIDRQIALRRREMESIRREISEHMATCDRSSLYPSSSYHSSTGRLTVRGVLACHRLFEGGLSDQACAYLMNLSVSAIKARRRAWRLTNSLSPPTP